MLMYRPGIVLFSVISLFATTQVSARTAASIQAAPCVDINSATSAELQRIIHIGPARADHVIALRKATPFRSVDDLTRVIGIAEARLRDIKAQGLACAKSPRQEAPPPGEAKTGTPCIDINSASETELQRIVQIGAARARAIIALRPFSSVDDLTRVSGIAEARLAQIKAQGLACVRTPRAGRTSAVASYRHGRPQRRWDRTLARRADPVSQDNRKATTGTGIT